MSGRYCFVVPRFGEGFAGGAEALVGALARRLVRRGDRVEVLTTCARDNRTWANELPPGVSIEDGLVVRRFPVDPRDLDRWIPLQIRVSEGLLLTTDEGLDWMRESVNSLALYDHLSQKGHEFDAIFFAPYLFGTSFWGALVHPERSILIPCLHDESYAYTEVIGAMFRIVGRALFNAPPEGELAERLYGPIAGGDVGMGFDPLPAGEPESLSPYFEDDAEYLLYVGRKETLKNVPLLIDSFVSYKDRSPGPLKLVIAGGGSFSDLGRPAALARADVVDVGHCSEIEKRRLIRHSLALCQPSTNESFSIVIMEAWRLSVPVIVHARCAVTRYHAVESGGGLFFGSQEDFDGVVTELLTNPELGSALARAGKAYVEERYSWTKVLERFDGVMASLAREAA